MIESQMNALQDRRCDEDLSVNDKIKNALTVCCTGLRKLIEDNSLNDADGTKIVSIDLEFQADCLCQIGLGEKISQYKYKFNFDKLNYMIAELLTQAL